MKYIMFEDRSGGKMPVIFHELLVHSVVADGLVKSHRRAGVPITPVSAGFVDISTYTTHGKSESMGLESKPTDGHYLLVGQAAAYMGEEMVTALAMKIKDRLEFR